MIPLIYLLFSLFYSIKYADLKYQFVNSIPFASRQKYRSKAEPLARLQLWIDRKMVQLLEQPTNVLYETLGAQSPSVGQGFLYHLPLTKLLYLFKSKGYASNGEILGFPGNY